MKAIVKRLGYISDGSFSPSLIKLNQAAFIQLYVEMLGKERLKEAKEFEEKTGAKIRVVTPNWNETIKSIRGYCF